MDDLLADIGIPESLWKKVASKLVCPRCGANLDDTTEAGLESGAEKHFESLRERWRDRYSARFRDLYGFLEKYPYLGAHHKLGRQILTQLSKLPRTEIQNEKWYRARNIVDGRQLSCADMYPPKPEEKEIPEGRYNHFGQRAFYMASTSDGALREVLKANERVAWVQEFKVASASNVLNLIPEQGEDPPEGLTILTFAMMYGGVLSQPVARSEGWKPEYFIPRFVADCAKSHGFEAIKFLSSWVYHSNLVLFACNSENVVPVGQPFLTEPDGELPFLSDDRVVW
jgi:hypothetical protein